MDRHLTKIEKQKTESRAQQRGFDSRKLVFSWRIIDIHPTTISLLH